MKDSIWTERLKIEFPKAKVPKHFHVDVAVIGAGITGVTSAYLLSRKGKKVALIEKGEVFSGETRYTTAFLNYPIDADLQDLKKTFDEETAARAWQSIRDTIDKMEQIIFEEGIDCEFVRAPLYIYAVNEKGKKDLEKEYEIAKKYNFPVKLEQGDIGLPYEFFLQCNSNAKFHPLKYLQALLKKALSYGTILLENTEALSFEGQHPIRIKTNHQSLTADHVIFATHNPPSTFQINSRLTPYQSYVIAAKIPKNKLREAMYIDTQDPYFYFRIDKKEKFDLIILGGADHFTGKAESKGRHKILEDYLKNILPGIKYEITHKWSGQVLESIDGLPFIGPDLTNPHHHVAAGFAGDGMVYGSLSAFINADAILGKRNVWADLYNPKRIKKFGNFLLLGAKYVKEFIKGRIATRGVLRSIQPDSGQVIIMDGKKVAVYKDTKGKITKLSPVCTHLGCIVNFNDKEKTWDCPCHGSRFYKFGEVKNGPAAKPLKKLN